MVPFARSNQDMVGEPRIHRMLCTDDVLIFALKQMDIKLLTNVCGLEATHLGLKYRNKGFNHRINE